MDNCQETTKTDRELELDLFRAVINTDFSFHTEHNNIMHGGTTKAGLFNQGTSAEKLKDICNKLGRNPLKWGTKKHSLKEKP